MIEQETMNGGIVGPSGPHAKVGTGEKNGQEGGQGGSVSKRLQQELMSIMTSGEKGVSAFPDGDSLFSWVGTIEGPTDTAYEGLSYRLRLQFTGEYPFKAPVVKFETPCFHPNVDTYGNICLDILKEKWSAAYSVKTILQSIQSLLGDANVDSPLNVQAADMWAHGGAPYREMVMRLHGSGAS